MRKRSVSALEVVWPEYRPTPRRNAATGEPPVPLKMAAPLRAYLPSPLAGFEFFPPRIQRADLPLGGVHAGALIAHFHMIGENRGVFHAALAGVKLLLGGHDLRLHLLKLALLSPGEPLGGGIAGRLSGGRFGGLLGCVRAIALALFLGGLPLDEAG